MPDTSPTPVDPYAGVESLLLDLVTFDPDVRRLMACAEAMLAALRNVLPDGLNPSACAATEVESETPHPQVAPDRDEQGAVNQAGASDLTGAAPTNCPACAGAMPADQMGWPLQAEHARHTPRASIGPDSERIRELEAALRYVDEHGLDYQAPPVATALRAAGLLPGPDEEAGRPSCEPVAQTEASRGECLPQSHKTGSALETSLQPGPDDIVVNREVLELWMANSGVTWQMLEGDYRKRVAFAGQSLTAALSQPHPKETP